MRPDKEQLKNNTGNLPTIAWGLEYLSECVYYKTNESLTHDANLSNFWKDGE